MRSIGGEYEEKASKYLEGLGYGIVERNFTIRGGEVDIVAREGGDTVFIEVKARRNASFGGPFEAVTPAKRRRIVKTALFYLKKNGIKIENIRFDVLGITEAGGKTEFELIKDAFYAEGYYV
ncbi:MAG: YraN family protein [Elusimicrobia bacterium CG08_land_8_20_14_0_20_51_18]|nr:MAG: YraN family protein [Elusimicrobia bacterium CG08_land_8_20_14_0_20_51_18]